MEDHLEICICQMDFEHNHFHNIDRYHLDSPLTEICLQMFLPLVISSPFLMESCD